MKQGPFLTNLMKIADFRKTAKKGADQKRDSPYCWFMHYARQQGVHNACISAPTYGRCPWALLQQSCSPTPGRASERPARPSHRCAEGAPIGWPGYNRAYQCCFVLTTG